MEKTDGVFLDRKRGKRKGEKKRQYRKAENRMHRIHLKRKSFHEWDGTAASIMIALDFFPSGAGFSRDESPLPTRSNVADRRLVDCVLGPD